MPARRRPSFTSCYTAQSVCPERVGLPEDFLDPNFISSVMGIIVIDLVLSGDNAVVIALAARRLPAKQQTVAIVVGGGGAIVLRITFTALAALLLTVPLLQAIGGDRSVLHRPIICWLGAAITRTSARQRAFARLSASSF